MTSRNNDEPGSTDPETGGTGTLRDAAARKPDAGLPAAALNAESLLAYNPSTPVRARGLWLAGDWDALARIDPQSVREAPNRGELLMLIASAYSNLGHDGEAHGLARKALQWGCSRRFAALILTASFHNTLGRIAALRQDAPALERHFRSAVNASAEDDLPVQVRSVREMAKLGLLPQAASTLRHAVLEIEGSTDPLERSKRLKQLKLEADLLKQLVSIAVRNGQVLAGPDEAKDGPIAAAPGALDEAELKRLSTSQLGQDIWVIQKAEFKRGGFFVEFGATDGVLLSNTYMLEAHFAWEGLLAEPNPAFFKDLHRNRRCIVSDACIDAKTGDKKDFMFADVYGGIREYTERDQLVSRREAYGSELQNNTVVETISLNDFLKKYHAPKDIDYISIDTEGNELEIISTFDFEYWNVRFWTIEHNFTPQRQVIRDLMAKHGYRCVEALHDDWFYR